MRQLAIVGAGLTLAGILIALTMGVFMEINVGFPTSVSTSRAIAQQTLQRSQSDQQAKLAGVAETEATSQQPFVTIKQSVSIGTEVLPAGTRLELVSKQGSDVWIRHKGVEYAIPISVTNAK